MSNDALMQAKCSNDAPLLGPRAEIGKAEGFIVARADATRTMLPFLTRCFSQSRRGAMRGRRRRFPKMALVLALATTSATSFADPPKPPNTKPDAANAAKPSSPAARSKGTAPPPAPPPLKSEPEGPDAEGKTRARAIFEQGVAAYKDGRYAEAVELFLETNRIYPDSKLSFNVARAYEALGSNASALRYYREYLRGTPSAADRADVEASVRQLELALSQKGVQQISVFSTPDAAVLSIDGRPVALTPWTGETWAGKHRLAVTHPGYLENQQVVELSAMRALDVQIELQPEPPPRPPSSEPKAESGHGVEVLTVATLAASAVLLGSALAVELSDADEGLSSTAAFLAGAGVGATAVGGVLFYFDLSGNRSK